MVTVPRGTPRSGRLRTHHLRSRVRGGRGSPKQRSDLDCGNSGTAMRLLAGVTAAAPFRSVLTGDESLATRPMERVAEPLRAMGATVATTDGHAPIVVHGGALSGIDLRDPGAHRPGQERGARGRAQGRGPDDGPGAGAHARSHRAWRSPPSAPRSSATATSVTIEPFQHRGFEGRVPGDPSSAAFLVAAAALTGSELTITGVGSEPHAHPLPGRDGADGGTHRGAHRPHRARGTRRRPLGGAVRRRARDPRRAKTSCPW